MWQLGEDDSVINMKIYKTKSSNDRKNKVRELRPLDIKTDYKAMITK